VIKIAETIRHLPKTYEHIGVYRVDAHDELEALKVDEAVEGDVIAFCYQLGDQIIEVYRGVLGHKALELVQPV
jgi:tRNA A37 threonylcarbamoyladenosine biosynthesis protein TsaE